MAEYTRTILLTTGFCDTAWQTTWRTDPLVRLLEVQRSTYQTEFNTCAWNLHVLNKNKESTHVYSEV